MNTVCNYKAPSIVPIPCVSPTLIPALCGRVLAWLLAVGWELHVDPGFPAPPPWATSPTVLTQLGPAGEPQLGSLGALRERSGWQFMVCGTSSLPTHDLSRRCFPWKAAAAWNPLPGRQAALPQVLAEFIRQAGWGVGGGGRGRGLLGRSPFHQK